MRFAHPQMLWLLLMLGPLLAAFLVWAWRKKQSLIKQFVPQRLLPQLTSHISQPKQMLRLALLGLAAICALLALARPQWGYRWEEIPRRGLDLVIAIDASRSMLARDLPPDRLTRARLAALDLARLSPGDRLALVPFAGTAYLQCPLTIDYEAFRHNLEAVDVSIMPQGGTSLAQAIRVAHDTLSHNTHNDRVLVLFSDGEDHDGGAVAAARKAALAGIRIFTVGIGTPEGSLLQYLDESGALQYIKDPQGNAVLSRLDEDLLQQIAREGNGFYLPLRAPNAIDTLAQQGLARLSRSDQSSDLVRRFHERFHWPLTLAIAFLIAELLLSERRVTSPSRHFPARQNRQTSRAAVCFLSFLILPMLAGSPARALKQFEAGAFDKAEATYDRLLEQRGPDPRLQYNRGTAAYRRGDFAAAARDFAEVSTAPDLQLQQRAHYNLGNALYRLGEQLGEDPQRIEPWTQAVQSYQAALQLDPDDLDAHFNLRFVQAQLQSAVDQAHPQHSSPPDVPDHQQDDAHAAPSHAPDSEPQRQPQPDPSRSPETAPTRSPPTSDPFDDAHTPDDSVLDSDLSEDQDVISDTAPAGTDPTPATASAMPDGPLSPEEARQLLDAARQEERAMIFAPPPPSRPSRILKDW